MIPEQIQNEIRSKAHKLTWDIECSYSQNWPSILEDILRAAYEDKVRAVSEAWVKAEAIGRTVFDWKDFYASRDAHINDLPLFTDPL